MRANGLRAKRSKNRGCAVASDKDKTKAYRGSEQQISPIYRHKTNFPLQNYATIPSFPKNIFAWCGVRLLLCVKRGKSGLLRLGFHLTNGYRKVRESATESKPPRVAWARVKWRGKSPPSAKQLALQANPIRSKNGRLEISHFSHSLKISL